MESHKKLPFIKVYDGYGYSGNIVIYGHVFKSRPHTLSNLTRNGLLSNMWQLFKLFRVETIANARLEAIFGNQCIKAVSASDGFFKFEIVPETHLAAGWHSVEVRLLDLERKIISSGTGRIFVPHLSQFAFISDIDDTIIRSFSSKIFKRLYELIARNPTKRRLFDETAKHYHLLADSFTREALRNPFFYVSSSEWNLYEYLQHIFQTNHLPQGIFLLNQIKNWHELVLTGKTGHEGKFLRIVRILKAFPKQRFVLLGDNSQKDPEIYAGIADKYPHQIAAIYIRNVRASKEEQANFLLKEHFKNGIPICIFKDSKEAILHGINIGLIERNLV